MANNVNNGTTNKDNKSGTSRANDPNTPNPANPASTKARANQPKSGTIPPANNGPKKVAGRSVPVASTQRMSRRMAARHQRDLKRQRQLLYAAVAIIVLVVIVFAIGIYQTLIGPNIKTLASFDGMSVNSGDYYTYRKIVLFNELGQIQNISGSVTGDQQQQVQQEEQSLEAEISNIQGSPVDQTTLEQLVSNMILEKQAKDQFGITVSDSDLNQYLSSQFSLYTPTANPDQTNQTKTAGVVVTANNQSSTKTASVITPLPTPTVAPPSAGALPTNAAPLATDAAGTITAQANQTPAGTPSVVASGTPANTPAVVGTSGSTPANTPVASPAVSATTTVSGTATDAVTATPAPTSTPLPANIANATAQARQNGTLQSLQSGTGVSSDDYKKFWIKPQLLQQRVEAKLISQVPVPGQNYNQTQLRLRNIVVADQQTAKSIVSQLNGLSGDALTTKFSQLARTNDASTAPDTAARNGDIGYIVQNEVDPTYWDAVSKLNIGQFTTDPIHTTQGWNVALVTDKQTNAAMQQSVYSYLTDSTFVPPTGFPTNPAQNEGSNTAVYAQWLKQQVDAAHISYFTPPTPTPSPSPLPTAVFTPVIPPTATPTTAPDTAGAVAGTPGASAAATTSGTPVAGSTTTVAATTTDTSAATTSAAATTLAATATTSAATTTQAVTPTP